MVNSTLSPRIWWSQRLYTALAWLFVAGVIIQVLLAGLAMFESAENWDRHIQFVHLIEFFPILMLIAAFVGKMPVYLRWLAVAEFVLIGLQYFFIGARDSADTRWIAAFHVVNALLIFWVAMSAAQSSRRLVFP